MIGAAEEAFLGEKIAPKIKEGSKESGHYRQAEWWEGMHWAIIIFVCRI